MKFENSVIINQPVRKVFDFVTNFENNAKWQSDILELELTSKGAFELGSTYRCVNRFLGKRIETEGVVTDYEPEQICSFQINSGAVTGESSYFFEMLNGATKFTTTADLDLGYFKLGKIILRRLIIKQMKNDMFTLKKLMENGKRR